MGCETPYLDKESPDGCCNCDWMNWWSAFETEGECNDAFRKEYPKWVKE